jgi:hypothetical protein
VTGAVDDVNEQLIDNHWAEWAEDAREAGRIAYEAMYGVSYGHSPGGLIDIQRRLEQLRAQWAAMAAAGVEAGSNITESIRDAQKELDQFRLVRNLRHEVYQHTLSDFDAQLADIEHSRVLAIENFMEQMVGASQELINEGLWAINRASQFEVEEALAARAAEFANTLEELSRSLTLEGLSGNPLEQQLQALIYEYQDARESLLESLEGASQTDIDNGIRMLDELFERRRQRIINEAQEDTDTIVEMGNQINRREAQGTLAWAMSDAARNGLSAAAVAQAIQLAMGNGLPGNGKLEVLLPIGKRIERVVVDLTKEAARDRRFNVEQGNIVSRLS